MTKIKNPKLFEAVFNAVKDKADTGDFPEDYILAGTFIERISDNYYVSLASNGLVLKSSADNALEIRDAHQDKNRFTGTAPFSHIKNMGGLYCYRHEEAGLAESMHYGENMETLPMNVNTKRVSIPHLLATKAVFRIRTLKAMKVANISPFSGGGAVQRFFRDIQENDASVKSLLGGVPLINKILDPNDYSAGRAVGLAFSTVNYIKGIQSQTARSTERYGTTGDNLCIFGTDGKVPNLEVESVMLTFSSAVSFNQDGKEMKLNSADESKINHFLPNWTVGENSVRIEVDTGFKMGMQITKY